MPEQDIQALRAECDLATKFWGRIWAGFTAIVFREKGEEAAKRFMVLSLGNHQSGHYLEGLRKLGIRDDEPPAVRAAKYHYLSNAMGGLNMEYIEESPKKVWIRYLAPSWAYPGVAMMALPSSIRKGGAEAWHAKNGALMGCPRLGWVSTKSIMDMEPYDEGYFIEYDHDLAPGESYRIEPAVRTPEFDPSKQPRLDPAVWPEARLLKAQRNLMRQYFRTAVEVLFRMYGEQYTYFLVSQVMRGVAIQFTHELKREMGIEATDAKAVAEFHYNLQRASSQEVQLTPSRDMHSVILRSHLPFGPENDELRAARFEFTSMATRLISGRVSVVRKLDGEAEIWEFCNAGRWLW
ncbi:hypothetical protein [Bradyrhizobium sp. CCBAU 11445]|uniref:hypothetical protein n=1 Tax=Bradyrhizobium sp. CCBAU 11445 TaxID=1630896 RepID=UPI0023066FB1|nr:hypothetical protein [Bradyrhizobium sp. CCBAU 11445]